MKAKSLPLTRYQVVCSSYSAFFCFVLFLNPFPYVCVCVLACLCRYVPVNRGRRKRRPAALSDDSLCVASPEQAAVLVPGPRTKNRKVCSDVGFHVMPTRAYSPSPVHCASRNFLQPLNTGAVGLSEAAAACLILCRASESSSREQRSPTLLLGRSPTSDPRRPSARPGCERRGSEASGTSLRLSPSPGRRRAPCGRGRALGRLSLSTGFGFQFAFLSFTLFF